jgi:hypothetical protein
MWRICILMMTKEVDETLVERRKEIKEEKLIPWVYTWKYSTIASGATTIGSAEHAPDDIIIAKLWFDEMKSRHNVFERILEISFFNYSLGGYSHQERWARTRWCFLWVMESTQKTKEDLGSVITTIGREFFNQGWITRIFCTLKQSNKAATYDSRVASMRQNLNAVVEIYHEGKTPWSVLRGPVYAHGCALLVFIRVYDAKKILVGALGTLRITGIHFL